MSPVSRPSEQMAWMVELLCEQRTQRDGGGMCGQGGDPMRVLQAGAGGPLLTALLCRSMGDRHVVLAELDPRDGAESAAALERLGWHPEVLTAAPGPLTACHGLYDAILLGQLVDAGQAAQQRAWRRVAACLSQLAPGGRLLVWPTGPGCVPPLTVGIFDRVGDGQVLHRRRTAPQLSPAARSLAAHPLSEHPLASDERNALAVLVADQGLRAEIRAAHCADAAGYCRGCAELCDTPQPSPCPTRTLADLADVWMTS
ncbi:hypothetical protein AFB00_17385 [Pseudonocardia sp. HH130630-07]|nr:hypothetical protein AFB00_17385 [Pseudonocardia sp. HH130630-07]